MMIGKLVYEKCTNGEIVPSVMGEKFCPFELEFALIAPLNNHRSISMAKASIFLYKYKLRPFFPSFGIELYHYFDDKLKNKLDDIIHDFEIKYESDIRGWFINNVEFEWTWGIIGDYERLLWLRHCVTHSLNNYKHPVIIF